MPLHADPLSHGDRYQCPDHFGLERRHPGTIAAWSIALVVLVVAIGLLGARLKMHQGSEARHGTMIAPAGRP